MLFHSYCFDFSVWEIFGALLTGGRLVVAPGEVTRDMRRLEALVVERGVTVLNLTPSVFYVLQEQMAANADDLKLRWLIFGGESLNPVRVRKWKERYKGCRVVNMYGITETTVHVTYQELEERNMESTRSVIGKAIPTLRSYILDQWENPVPVGVRGEIYVSGAGVARGYLNLPELTAERFMADPFEEGGRMYRTGDRGRWLGDGRIEYLGRADEQVKIRGYRIELGEIESKLMDSGMVKGAAVAMRGEEGSRQLVGYVVPEAGYERGKVIRHLKRSLPEQMVPVLWVELDRLPLTSNGKIDRKGLPPPDPAGQLNETFVSPRTHTECVLAEIWEESLGFHRVGIKDNYFQLGGDSIRSIRVIYKIRERFQKDINLSDLSGTGSLEDLAALIDASRTKENELDGLQTKIEQDLNRLKQAALTRLDNPGLVEDIYPLSDIQIGMVYSS